MGMTLAELVAQHIAAMRPDVRASALDDFRRSVEEMIPDAETLIFPDGSPAEWRRQ
jgi:hypothetical protein